MICHPRSLTETEYSFAPITFWSLTRIAVCATLEPLCMFGVFDR